MKSAVFAIPVLAAFAAFADPSITDQSLVRNADGSVTITYTLVDGPAIVTLDMLDNGVSIGATNLWALSGDVNMVVDKTACSIRWNPSVAWKGHLTSKLSAALTAWKLTDPPDYLVFDLTPNPVVRKRYYASEDAIPGGILANEAYRRYLMPMRRMHSKGVAWTMGTSSESTYYNADEAEHTVTLDHDYYIGVFEVTRGQYATVTGGWNPVADNAGPEHIVALRPIVRTTYGTVRGNDTDNLYPAAPSTSSITGKFLARAGDSTIDLPSEAEWEFAARGGHYGDTWGDGSNISGKTTDDNLAQLGRYSGNKDSEDITDGTRSGFGFCGSYKKNNYGLYDMNGNEQEWCIDWYQDDITWNTTGIVNANGKYHYDGVTTNAYRIVRGGYYGSNAQACRNARRAKYLPAKYYTEVGMRLVCRDTLP